MLVSLIIINYNGAALLPDCIDSALATLPPDAELLVVDNASTDASHVLLAGYGARVQLVPSPRNLGFGRACNLGAAAASGDLLVFLNPDVTFPAGWLEPLISAANSAPDIGLLCPVTIAPGAPDWQWDGPELADRGMLPGCCLMVRRAAWRDLDGFDQSFFLYWEDTELCWRAWLLGWRSVVVWRSWVYHQKGASTASFGRWDGERAKNSLYTYLKLMRWPLVLAYAARLLLVCIAKALLRPQLAAELTRAWAWNIAQLPATLRRRQSIQRRRMGEYAALERRVRALERAMRRQHRAS